MKADVVARHVVIEVMRDVVRIELHCGDAYAAQVLHDDMCERMRSGQGICLKVKQLKGSDHEADR